MAKPNPSKKPSRRTRILKVVKWLLIVTLVGMLALATTGYIVYKNTSIPDPNAEFLTETSHIYYSDGKTELGQLAVQKRDSIGFDEMPDMHQGRRRRGGERVVLDRQGHRSQGNRASRVQQREGQRHPGRFDDHPAVRQDPLPDPGAQHQAQGQGGVPVAEDPQRAEQTADPRGISEHDLLRPGCLRHRGGLARVLQQGRQEPRARSVRGPGQRGQQPGGPRPGQRRRRRDRPEESLRLCPVAAGQDGQDLRGRGGRGGAVAAEVPEAEGRGHLRRPARPRAHADQVAAAQARER